MSQKTSQLFIFRRDLRIQDNTGLDFLHQYPDPIIPIFIFAPDQIDPSKNSYFSNNCVQFMCESLEDLEKNIEAKGGKMNYFYGNTITILEKILKNSKYKIARIGVNQDYTPYSRTRDEKIEALCKKNGVEFWSKEDICIQPIGSVRTGSGTIYKKYTPYYNKAKELPIRKPVGRTSYNFAKIQVSPKGSRSLLTKFYKKNPNLLHPGGRENALRQLAHLPADYQKTRNTPSIPTTELSAYNKFGCISIRELMAKLDKDTSRELYFRDFYYNIIYYYPYILGGAFDKKWDKIKWDKPNPSLLRAFYEGRTGFPIIDAGIRQMTTTGFMHNRLRMLVASFFTKDLLYDWRIGERFFANHLYDYDPTQNNCGWQVVAGFGPSALDWFRVMNPWLQTEKFDPECVYIKKWVPELSKYSAKQIINQDWNAKDYPRPIVNHEEAKKKMMAVYKNVSSY
jgi:deoxyribodipyrimidine photo-lyase